MSLWLLLLGPTIITAGNVILRPLTPKYLKENVSRIKWRATFISRLNAAITGVWAVLVLCDSELVRLDLLYGVSSMARACLTFSFGVHAGELVEMVRTSQYSMLTWHHVGSVLCLTGILHYNIAIGFCILCLTTEINAVFNKTRILHLITQLDRESLTFRVNARINIVTYFLRVLIVFWMHGKSLQYFMENPNLFFCMCFITNTFLNLWNIQCLKTLIQKDLIRKTKINITF